jgi:hypothetical protein
MLPLTGTGADAPPYLTLDEALASGKARVTEVSAQGHVPELRFANLCDQPILLIDGEELMGAKQNRVLNVTILVPPKTELVIPVSCVEAGRWAGAGEFRSAPHVMYATGRAQKVRSVGVSMATAGTRRSDQAAVWQSIASLAERQGVKSATSRLDDVYIARGDKIGEYVEKLRASDGQLGAMFALGGKIRGIEAFEHPALLRKVLPKLVRSWAMDALSVERGGEEPQAAEVERRLGELAALSLSEHPAVGLGREVRFESQRVTGGALLHEGRVVHLCAFWVEDEAAGDTPRGFIGRMLSASRRARGNRS